MLVASGWLPWIREGNGSTYAGLSLADQLRHGVLVPEWGRVAGIAIYAVVASGALVLLSVAARAGAAAAARSVIATVIVAAFVGLAASGAFPVGAWDIGVWLVMAGAAITVASSWRDTRRLWR